jgi:hypothetical protein
MRWFMPFLTLLVLTGCTAATVPDPSPTPTVCPSLATVNAYVGATVRFDGASAATFFTSDGFIEAPNASSHTKCGGPNLTGSGN